MTTKESLIEFIELAFSARNKPTDDQILDQHHQNQPSAEARNVHEYLKGRTWRQLQFTDSSIEHSALYYLSPTVLLYYLQAYLIFYISNYEQKPGLFHIYPITSTLGLDKNWENASKLKALMSEKEIEAVQRFLAWCIEKKGTDHPMAADLGKLQKFWSPQPS